ncbi:hypothetical protein [Patulibacter defluvii]|uniref:hypothetical protein n=1 Tax=Patulibacter defluvii TaxID=3095358 RepID=UPI002A7620AF|nr:hypothetical protein [Patulibacter sp. DM4]
MGERPTYAERIVGSAALTRDAVADARRGHPDVDLAAYAAARGLAALGSQNASGYFAALPAEPELQHNVLRGVRRGRDACLWHWRFPWPLDDDNGLGPGGFHGVRIRDPLSRLWSAPRRWWSRTAADNRYAAVPCTGAAALAPEAALLPDLRIDNGAKHLPRGAGERRLDDHGLRGFTLTAAPDQLDRLEQLAAGPLGRLLRGHGDRALIDLRLRFGTVIVRRDGYARDERELDALLDLAVDAAAALAAAAASLHAPQPFAEPLPAVDWPSREPSVARPWPPSPFLEQLHALAAERDLTLEDPRAYHAAFPTNPVPGTAFAVLRGPLPGAPGATARLALHAEAPIAEVNSGRTALLLPAGDAAATDPGGVALAHDGDPLRCAVHDGLLAVWILRWRPHHLGDLDALLRRGVEHAREVGALPPARNP